MKLLLTLLLITTVSCAVDSVSTSTTNNPEVRIGLLFTHEGCSVYRFHDAGNLHYYTDCTSTETHRSCGKGCYRKESVETGHNK